MAVARCSECNPTQCNATKEAIGMTRLLGSFVVMIVLALTSSADAQSLSKDVASRIEAIPIQTLTLSDEQFLKGVPAGEPVTIAGTLRVAQGEGRLPLVVFVAGSGGFAPNTDVWGRAFERMGISTFIMDSFAARGIVSTVYDQSLFGRLNGILDLYRSLSVLAAHPRVDPSRIAVMGFSRGGHVALYASMKRFQRMWNVGGIEPAAYIALYPSCFINYVSDSDVSDHPIRIFHGTSDDYVESGPCRSYVARTQLQGKDIKITEFTDTWHAFYFPNLPRVPVVVKNAQATHCVLKEVPIGTIVNVNTQQPFKSTDDCVQRSPHVAYSSSSTQATEEAIKTLLATTFKLN